MAFIAFRAGAGVAAAFVLFMALMAFMAGDAAAFGMAKKCGNKTVCKTLGIAKTYMRV